MNTNQAAVYGININRNLKRKSSAVMRFLTFFIFYFLFFFDRSWTESASE